jgi:predicted DNA-binding protein (MmcQ/YjbR family)
MGHDQSGMKTAEGIQLCEKVRSICHNFPEVEELIDGHGHTTFKVSGKSFIMMGEHNGATLTFKSDLENQEFLVQQGQYFRPKYIGHRGWVSIRNPEDWEEMGLLLKEAYLRAAPKRLAKQLTASE